MNIWLNLIAFSIPWITPAAELKLELENSFIIGAWKNSRRKWLIKKDELIDKGGILKFNHLGEKYIRLKKSQIKQIDSKIDQNKIHKHKYKDILYILQMDPKILVEETESYFIE